MNIRLLLLMGFCWSVPATMRAEAAELDFGIYEASARLFSKAEAATLPEHGKADVKAVLKARGFDLPEDSTAYYDAATARIFLRSTARDLRRLEQLVQHLAAAEGTYASVKQVKMNAICYAIPLADLPAEFGPQSTLKSLPEGKLTVIDRTSLICRGGQKAQVTSRRDALLPPKIKPAPDPDEPPPPVGERTFEYECTVSEDSALIDLNLFWEIHSEKLAPEGQMGKFRVSAQLLAAPGSTVIQELGLTEEEEPRLVLLALEFYIVPSKPADPPANPAEAPAK